MAKNRMINTSFWDDAYIMELDPIEKLLFLYFLTCPLTDLCGAYQITLKRIAFDTGIDRDMVLKILDRFEAAGKMYYRDGWLIIKNFSKHQASNPNVDKGIARSLSACPDWVKETLTKGFESLSKGGAPEPKLEPELRLELEQDIHPVISPEPDPDPAVGEEPLPPGEPPTARKPDPVVEVFDYWVVKMGKNRAAKLTSDRRQKVKARLREGYTVEQIKQAIDGCSVDPFYMGDNVSGKTYNDLTLICRTGSKIEEFIERSEGPFAQKPQASLPGGTDLTLPSRSTWADLQEVMALDAEINGNWAPYLDPVAYRKAAGEYAARGPVEKAEVDEYENSPAYVKRFDIAPF